jgi:hypothetical protein
MIASTGKHNSKITCMEETALNLLLHRNVINKEIGQTGKFYPKIVVKR